MTLTEFLLARLDELEGYTEQGRPRGEDPFDEARSAGWFQAEVFGPEWVLADIEAKRRIVRHFAEKIEGWEQSQEYWMDDGVKTLCLLALPYADHPDYDEAWRP